jgi:hypothetical protein
LAADIVCDIRPVEANKGCKCFGGLWLHGWISARVVQLCPGTCLRALCAGMRESRCRGRLCVGVDERKGTCGVEDRLESVMRFGLHIRPPRVPVPACPDSSLPGVCIITESRTVYL